MYESVHTKLVKHAIATMCLESALKKLCGQKMSDNLCTQIGRPVEAGFSRSVIVVTEFLLQNLKDLKLAKANSGEAAKGIALWALIVAPDGELCHWCDKPNSCYLRKGRHSTNWTLH